MSRESLVGGRKAARPGRTAPPWRLSVWPVVRGSVSAIQTSALPLSRPQPARPDRILFPRDRLPADAVVEQNSTLARWPGAPADELSPDQVDKAEADAAVCGPALNGSRAGRSCAHRRSPGPAQNRQPTRPAAILEKAIPCCQPRRCDYGARRDRTDADGIATPMCLFTNEAAGHGTDDKGGLFRPVKNNTPGELEGAITADASTEWRGPIRPRSASRSARMHSLATNALDHQADIAKVKGRLGHANIGTTQIYHHRRTRPRTARRSRWSIDGGPPRNAASLSTY